jgi:hypothetical protein
MRWWYFTPLALLPFLFKRDTSTREERSLAKQQIADAIAAEARRQGVDPRVALAYAELESGFTNADNGVAYGPLQVNAKFYAGPASDLLGPIGIVEGVRLVKKYLEAAGGDPELGRVMYLCGIAGARTCSETTKARVRARWAKVAPKYGLA